MDQEIAVTIKTPGNLSDTTIKNIQSTTQKLKLINFNDPTTLTTVSSIYTTLVNKLIKEYKKKNMALPFSSIDSVSQTQIKEIFKESLSNMTIGNNIINIVLDDDTWKKGLSINDTQTFLLNQVVQQISTNFAKEIFNQLFSINISEKCKSLSYKKRKKN